MKLILEFQQLTFYNFMYCRTHTIRDAYLESSVYFASWCKSRFTAILPEAVHNCLKLDHMTSSKCMKDLERMTYSAYCNICKGQSDSDMHGQVLSWLSAGKLFLAFCLHCIKYRLHQCFLTFFYFIHPCHQLLHSHSPYCECVADVTIIINIECSLWYHSIHSFHKLWSW